MEARKPRIVRPYVFPAVRSRFHAMNLALPAPTGYAPPPAGLTLYAVEASALPTDEALMLAWAGGDLRAFESLYARHRKRLFGFLLRQLRDNALAEEIFQDVWQRVISARAGLAA
jgi:RNA polymerase sigma-70 factor (ECF subfamily)